MRIDNPIGINAALTGSFSGSFFGNGSGLTGVAASNVEYTNVLNKPTLLSGSAQIASQISGSFSAVSASIASRFDNLGSGFATDTELANVSSSVAGDITNIYNTYATDTELANVSSSIATRFDNLGSGFATDTELADVSSSIATRFDNLGSGFATDTELANVSASIAGDITNIYNTYATDTELANVSSSLASNLTSLNTTVNNLDSTYATDGQLTAVSSSIINTISANLQTFDIASGSFATRIDSVNTTINNLGNTYATDSELSTISGSFATRLTTDESNISTATSVNSTQNNRLAALEAATGSYQSGLTFSDTAGQGGIDFTNTAGTISATVVGLGTTSNVTFNNVTINGTSTAQTPSSNDNSTKIATTAYVQTELTDLIGGASAAFDTLIEISASLASGDTTLNTLVDGKLSKASNLSDLTNTSTARTNLGVAIGSDVQAYNATLASVAGGTYSGDDSITTIGTIVAGNVTNILPAGTVSGSAQIALGSASGNIALSTQTTGDYVASLVAGTGITLANNTGEGATPTITNSAPDQTVVLTAGSNVTISGTYPSFTIASTDTNTTYTASTGLTLTGTAFSIDSTVATLTGTQTLTNKTINGSQLVDGSVANAKLASSTISGVSLGSNLNTLTIGTGLSGTSYNGSGAVTIANTGVTSITTNTGLSTNASATGGVTITNTGVTSNVAGNAITVSGATGAVTINHADTSTAANLTASSRTYVSALTFDTYGHVTAYSTATETVTDTNTVTTNIAGTGISVSSGTGNSTITNTGVTSIVAGTGITISGATGAVTITNGITNNNQLTNGSGYITASSSDTLTNKGGNISQWTNNSGYQTTSGQVAKVENTVSGTSSADLVYGNMADNDQFRIRIGGTSSNAGFVEIATADDATEPIYVRQYTGVFSSLSRTGALLDGSGNTTFPGDVTAYSSDERLKENVQNIPNALDKVLSLNGVTFDWKQEAFDAGFNPKIKKEDAGVLAQQVQAVLPQAVRPAPFDLDEKGGSRSGENYLTVQYEKLAPLFIEAIKEQQKQIQELKAELEELKNK